MSQNNLINNKAALTGDASVTVSIPHIEMPVMETQGSSNVFNFLLDAIRGQVFIASVEIGVLDLIADKKSIEDMSGILEIHHDKLMMFLNALVSMDVLQKHNENFAINPIYSELLVRKHDKNMVETILHLYKVRCRSSTDIIDILKSNHSTKATQPFASPEFWHQASDNLLSFHKSVMADAVFSILCQCTDLENIGSMMDLGAGSEVLAQFLIKNNPHMTVYIQDQIPLIDSIQERLFNISDKENQCPNNTTENFKTENIDFVSGDYNHVVFPKSLDLVLSSMSLYYATECQSLLQKVYEALAPKGIFISLHEGLSNHRTSPEAHVLGRLVPALSGNDSSFTKGDIASLMRHCGFQSIESSYITMPQGEMELVIGYKL